MRERPSPHSSRWKCAATARYTARPTASAPPTSEIEIIGTCGNTGTKITFLPDASIFTTTEYSYDVLSARLRELAYLNKGIRLSITDRRERDENGNFRGEVFYSVEGLKEFVKYLDENRGTPLTEDIIYIDTEKDGIPVEVAMQYNDSFSENVHSYVNNINTIEGGTHLTGFRRALTRTLKKYADDSGLLSKLKFDINGDDFREGLTAVVSVKVSGTAVRGSDENQAGQQRSGRSGGPGHLPGAQQLPRRESERCPCHREQGDTGRHGP